MKYIFLGTTEFSVGILKPLLDAGFPPALVVCNPDRPVGRKKVVTSPPVKPLAESASIPVLQPERIDADFVQAMSREGFDIGVLASYGKILPAGLLSAPRLGVIGVHVSLLPAFRGASPMQSVILSGDDVTGVTLYLMDEKVDHGPILASSEIPVARKNFIELQRESARVGADLLLKVLPEFAAGRIKPVPQEESAATFTKKFKTEDGFVDDADLRAAESGDPDHTVRIDRMIRALNPEPGVWTLRKGKRLKLLQAEPEGEKLKLTRIQWEGKNPEDR
jgi:methionyl-tRNA formyltransferase